MSRSGTDAGAPKLLDQVRELIRIRHYSIRTEQAYLQWIKRFILFHGTRHPRETGAEELTQFLSDLAIQRNVSASTQNQALNAILFLYRDVLKIQLPWLNEVQRARSRSICRWYSHEKKFGRCWHSSTARPGSWRCSRVAPV